jgi:hypothetical protein
MWVALSEAFACRFDECLLCRRVEVLTCVVRGRSLLRFSQLAKRPASVQCPDDGDIDARIDSRLLLGPNFADRSNANR